MAIGLNNLHSPAGATHKKKRVGRGPGSGLGKTAGRGNKGQKSRSGYSAKIGFEGGQMPLQRRLPKRGFTNIFKKQWIEVSLAVLEKNFDADDEVTPELLHQRGLIAKGRRDVVVLGTGDISKALRISAHRFTKSARAKIEGAGGAATLLSSIGDQTATTAAAAGGNETGNGGGSTTTTATTGTTEDASGE